MIKNSDLIYFGGLGQRNPQATLNSRVLTSQKAAAGTGSYPTKGEEIMGCLAQQNINEEDFIMNKESKLAEDILYQALTADLVTAYKSTAKSAGKAM